MTSMNLYAIVFGTAWLLYKLFRKIEEMGACEE